MNIKNIKQFDENSNYYAVIVNRIESRKAEFDKEVTALKVILESQNARDLADKKKLETALLEYAENNQDEILPEGKKTYTNAFVKLTIKLGSPALAYLTGVTESQVITELKELFKKKAARFITVKESLAKSVIMKAIKDEEISDEDLSDIGLEITQSTSITIKPL